MVLFAHDVERTADFYRALGVPLEGEEHGDAMEHLAADLDGVHVAILPADAASEAPDWRSSGSTFVGFWVSSLEAATDAVARSGARIVQPHQQREWGCRVVAIDPDGRAVEINQADHCPAAG